ncbi:unnamed protein product [Schistosoma mattheei]|uniref:Uncharacterized protein n=1 Tax=Schistosoma mattheei TaxID=31246 RepID=A0A3P8GFQ0_9TREM|nr:unnamed protein product [Schistosoma mattheei]
MAKLASYFSTQTQQGSILGAFLRATRDSFLPNRQAAITALAATQVKNMICMITCFFISMCFGINRNVSHYVLPVLPKIAIYKSYCSFILKSVHDILISLLLRPLFDVILKLS